MAPRCACPGGVDGVGGPGSDSLRSCCASGPVSLRARGACWREQDVLLRTGAVLTRSRFEGACRGFWAIRRSLRRGPRPRSSFVASLFVSGGQGCSVVRVRSEKRSDELLSEVRGWGALGLPRHRVPASHARARSARTDARDVQWRASISAWRSPIDTWLPSCRPMRWGTAGSWPPTRRRPSAPSQPRVGNSNTRAALISLRTPPAASAPACD